MPSWHNRNTTDTFSWKEYLEEVHACLEDRGKISAGVPWLLDKLRLKLGISERRAAELECCNNHKKTAGKLSLLFFITQQT